METNQKRILFTNDSKFEVTAVEGKRATLTGYAIVWNVLSSDRGGYRVRLLPNSAKPKEPVFALYHHNYLKPLARTDESTLRLTPDDYGVKVEIDLPDTTAGRDTEVEVAERLVKGMSFAMLAGGKYSLTKEKDASGNDIEVENYSSFDYDEVTITAIPAFTQSTIAVKEYDSVAALNANIEALADTQNEDSSKECYTHSKKLHTYKVAFYSLKLAELQQTENTRMNK